MLAVRRSTRQKLTRVAMYGVFVAALIVIGVAADWDRLQQQFFQVDIAREQFPEIVTIAAKNTVIFTAIAFAGGLLLGLLLALMKLSPVAPYRWVATIYIEVFRGIPALLTIFATAFVLPIAFGVRVPGGPVGASLVGLVIVAAAYIAEVLRAGIQAVPKGQVEAARSLGMSPTRTMFSVVLPQAVRIVVPPMTNEFVLLIKDTSLVFIAGVTPITRELTSFGRSATQDYANATPLVMAAIMYLFITIPLTQLVAYMERRSARLTR